MEIAPSERLTIERIRSFVSHLAETNTPRSVAIQIDALYKAARVMMPERDWTWLKAVKARLYAAAPAHLPAGPVITSVQLLDLGQQLMDESKPSPGTPIRMADAVRYRDGLMIALLAFIPLRRKNLAALEIGRHLVQEGDGWFVIIPREETKTGTPIEFAVPELLASVSCHLSRYRSSTDAPASAMQRAMGKPEGRALSHIPRSGEVITRHTASRLGFRIAPHDVRDAAATTWAISAPDQIGIARDLLAHSDLRTTTKHYNRARGIEASRAYTQLIAKKRKK